MKRITGLMKNICTMSNALLAYRKARRCKRYRPEVLEFEANREEYLSKARRELKSLTYTPGKYKVFIPFLRLQKGERCSQSQQAVDKVVI